MPFPAPEAVSVQSNKIFKKLIFETLNDCVVIINMFVGAHRITGSAAIRGRGNTQNEYKSIIKSLDEYWTEYLSVILAPQSPVVRDLKLETKRSVFSSN